VSVLYCKSRSSDERLRRIATDIHTCVAVVSYAAGNGIRTSYGRTVDYSVRMEQFSRFDHGASFVKYNLSTASDPVKSQVPCHPSYLSFPQLGPYSCGDHIGYKSRNYAARSRMRLLCSTSRRRICSYSFDVPSVGSFELVSRMTDGDADWRQLR